MDFMWWYDLMAITNYLELRQAIQDYSKRTDALNMLDTFIDLTESDIWQNLRSRDMEARATATTDTIDRFMPLPDYFLQMRKITLSSGGRIFDLEQLAPESLPINPAAGRPASYSVTAQLVFNRVPDSAYTAEMHYYRQLTPLSSDNLTNEILTRFPAVYLYGCLYHFAQWSHNDIMLGKYSTLFDEEMKRANKLDRRGRYGPGAPMKIYGPTP